MNTRPFADGKHDFILEDTVEHCFTNELVRRLLKMDREDVVHDALEYAQKEHPDQIEDYSGLTWEMEAIRQDQPMIAESA